MASVIRPTDRTEAVIRLPADRNPRQRQEARTPEPPVPPAPPAPAVVDSPEPAAPTLDAEFAHLGAVAAATITDTERGSLIEEALKAAQANAEQELVRLREEARTRGYEEGLAAGEQQARAEWDGKVERLAALAEELRKQRDAALAEAEDKLVELVFEATTRIVGEALATREGITALTRQVLTAARDQGAILTLRLAPADFELLGGTAASASKLLRPGVAIVADARVHLGGCLLDTEQGSIDGRLEIQLGRLKDALLEARHAQRK